MHRDTFPRPPHSAFATLMGGFLQTRSRRPARAAFVCPGSLKPGRRAQRLQEPGSFRGLVATLLAIFFTGACLVHVRPVRAAARSTFQVTTGTGSAGLERDAAQAAAPPSSDAGAYSELANTLVNWARAMQSNDPVREASFYAARLDRYFLREYVSNGFVLHDKIDFLRRGNRLQLFELENIALEADSPTDADLQLTKHYIVTTRATTTERTVRSRLQLHKQDGAWKITGEQDLK